MPSANQYLTIPPPSRGLFNIGAPWEAPPGSSIDLKNIVCTRGTSRLCTSRQGVARYSSVSLPGSLEVVYVGDAGTSGTASLPAIIITKQIGGPTPGRMYYDTGAAWGDLSGGATLSQTTNDLTWTLFDKAGTMWFLFSNGIEVKKWNRSVASAYANFTSAPEGFKACMVVSDRLIVGNLATSGAQWLDCSSALDFEAGWNINMVKLATTPGKIVAMRSMGATQGVIYCEDAIYLAIPQTGPAPFRYELRASGMVGPASERAVVQLPDNTHIYLGWDGQIYRFDGSNVAQACPLASHPLPAWRPAYTNSCGVFDPARGEIYFFVDAYNIPSLPDYTYPTTGVCISYPEMACFPVEYPVWYGIVPPVTTATSVRANCCGLVRPPIMMGATCESTRFLAFPSILFSNPDLSWSDHLGVAYSPYAADGGTCMVGTAPAVVPIEVKWVTPEVIPADGALVTAIEAEIMATSTKADAGFPATQNLTTRLYSRVSGKATEYFGATVDTYATGRKVLGFASSVSAQSAYLDFRLYGTSYSPMTVVGARLSLYSGMPGRR